MRNFPLRKNSALLIALFAGLSWMSGGCMHPAAPEFQSLLSEQPQVLEVTPVDLSRLQDPVEIGVEFSERVDVADLSDKNVVLVNHLKDTKLLEDAGDFAKTLEAGEISRVPMQYLLDDDERHLTLLPDAPLEAGIYYLVILPKLRSVRGIPFNQKPGERPTAFVARFGYGDVPQAGLEEGGETAQGGGGPVFGPKPETLVLNEVLYDGKVSDTDGESFVELVGTAGADISLYQILFINGEDGAETERITLPPNSLLPEDGLFLIADLKTSSKTESMVPTADCLDQFDPQNGRDGVHFLDRDGKLVDSVVYGTGAPAKAENGLALGEGNPAKDVAGGHSLSRLQEKDSQDNATDFVDLATPSPGIL
ncbi:MAG: hypothetical protein K8R69_10265 [Deltaproteobacteria bacterium]|nr:hypothetical protein [Deltaproteobacteria bacterium]